MQQIYAENGFSAHYDSIGTVPVSVPVCLFCMHECVICTKLQNNFSRQGSVKGTTAETLKTMLNGHCEQHHPTINLSKNRFSGSFCPCWHLIASKKTFTGGKNLD